jgi:hypothetical protein
MDFIAQKTKVFALLSLIFAISQSVDAQRDSIYRMPAGTKIRLSMDAGISSKISSVNDTFTTTVAKPILIDDVVILPFGTVIEGRVTKVSSADIGGKHGSMEIRLETIRFTETVKRTIDGVLVNELKPSSRTTASILSIFGGTAAGAVIGAVTGNRRGALAGAGIGAGAGIAVAFLKKGNDVSIKTDEEFEIELKSEVTLPASDY